MMPSLCHSRVTVVGIGALALALMGTPVLARQERFEPAVGQPGKDVVWVPTSPEVVERMLDIAKVTPEDFVIDLGSGDGRNIIAAAKRGARGLGVEYNPDMVELSRRLAREAGVADKATFVRGDMYEADISQATVMALFLLSSNLEKMKDRFLALAPGTRLVLNTFSIPGWEPDASETIEDGCVNWCTVLLYVVPARVAGAWRVDGSTLVLFQDFQHVSGRWTAGDDTRVLGDARLSGADIRFVVGGTVYAGKVEGDRMSGVATESNGATRAWTATRTTGDSAGPR